MKVKELIQILQGYNPELDVAIEGAMHLDPVTPDHYLWDGKMVILFDPAVLDQILDQLPDNWAHIPDTLNERDEC